MLLGASFFYPLMVVMKYSANRKTVLVAGRLIRGDFFSYDDRRATSFTYHPFYLQ